jgi:hypothetical protein
MIYGVEDEWTNVGIWTRTIQWAQKVYPAAPNNRKTIDITYRVRVPNTLVTLATRRPKSLFITAPVRPTLVSKRAKQLNISQGQATTSTRT